MSEENIPISAYAKHYGKSVAITVVSALATWGLTMFIDKCKDGIYNKFIKKPFCPICGGSGEVTTTKIVDGETITEKRFCTCYKPTTLSVFPRPKMPECFNKPLSRYAETSDDLGSCKFYTKINFSDMLNYSELPPSPFTGTPHGLGKEQ